MSNPLSDLLESRVGLKENALRKLNITEKEISQVIIIINEWFRKEPQMPKITPDPEYVAKIYIRNIGDLERTKQCLDLYYSLGSMRPDIFSNRDPLLPELQKYFEGIPHAFMPNFTEDGCRVDCFKFEGDGDNFNPSFYLKGMLMLYALRAHFDFYTGITIAFDVTHFSKGHKAKLTKDVIKTASLAVQYAFLGNLRFHFVNVNPIAAELVQYMKSLLIPSQQRNVWIHPNMESLYKVVDRKLLAKDFGGSQKSIFEIQKNWWNKAKEYRNWFLSQDQYRTDESKRVGKLPYEKLSSLLANPIRSKNMHKLIEISPELKQRTLKKLNLTQADIDKALLNITKWFVDQPHLPNIIPDPDFVERLFVVYRGNIEQTKYGLDLYYTLKTYTPEMFSNRDPLLPELKHATDSATFAFMYPLTSSGDRVLGYKFFKNADLFDVNNFVKMMLMEIELRIRYDYTSDIIVVVDIENIQPRHIEQLEGEVMRKLMFAAQGAYGFYLKEVHFINAPSYAQDYMQDIKQNIRPDFPTKVYFSDTIAKLHESVSKSVLPSDLGGDLPSIAESHKKWYDEMVEMREFFLKEDKHIVEESKRVDKSMLDNIYKL